MSQYGETCKFTLPIGTLAEGCHTHMGVGTNFGVGGRRGKAQRAESGDGVIGEGTASPSPPTKGFAGAL